MAENVQTESDLFLRCEQRCCRRSRGIHAGVTREAEPRAPRCFALAPVADPRCNVWQRCARAAGKCAEAAVEWGSDGHHLAQHHLRGVHRAGPSAYVSSRVRTQRAVPLFRDTVTTHGCAQIQSALKQIMAPLLAPNVRTPPSLLAVCPPELAPCCRRVRCAARSCYRQRLIRGGSDP